MQVMGEGNKPKPEWKYWRNAQHSQQFWNRLAYLEVLFILPEAILRGGRGGLQTTLSIDEHESHDKKIFTFCLQC